MSKEYSEDELVEKEAVKFLNSKFNYTHLNCFDEFKDGKSFLGRNDKSEVILESRLLESLQTLNSDLPLDAIEQTINEVKKDRSRMSLVKANEEVHNLIKNGAKVKAKIDDKITDVIVKIIDFEEPKNNDFFMATQLWITGEMYTKRPDLILFVNGIPLVLMEFKKTSVNLKKAYDDNITDYKDTIPQLFWYNSFILLSNGLDSKVGTLTSGYEHFANWKKSTEEDKRPSTYLGKILEGTCSEKTFIDLFENFIFFTSIENKPIKIIAKNHQYLGVNNSVESFKNRKENNGRLGVFWHTQGSGKSFSMIFFAQKILRKFEGNYTFVVVTDRQELDNQIYENFQNAGVVTEENVQAKDGKHLKKLLGENHRMIFTLIHKFGTPKGEKYPKLTDRDDVIIMTDEAHRTQYDTLALNMRNALPNAGFIGFTGTPLMKRGEEKTQDTFGDYVSKYTFSDAVEDKATVPLYYDNRVPELQLNNPALTDEIYEVIDDADISEKDQERVEKRLGSNYDILTREDRLNTIAEDIANHYLGRGYSGKAMVISIDKLTTVKMYNKVKYNLNKKLENFQKMLREASLEDREEIKLKINEIKSLDMAVVISSEQNEIKKFRDKGLNIKPHRERIVNEDLAKLYKDPNSNFKIAFICNMWMTGFDAPSVSTIYLDKPMKNHTLMQAIARANRVFEDKQAGFIVDYINIFRNLEKALALYASSEKGSVILPIEAKEELVKALGKYIEELNKFLIKNNVDISEINFAKGMDKYPLIHKALSSLVINQSVKKEFLTKAGNMIKIYKAVLPDKNASKYSREVDVLKELVKGILDMEPKGDLTKVIRAIHEVLDLSISSKGYIIKEVNSEGIDISKIDFNKLAENFQKNRDFAQLERLKNILSFKLKEMLQKNNSRIDFQEKFDLLIKDYNSGAINAETYFGALRKFSDELSDEETRHLREELSEEELALFDKLKKPELKGTNKKKVKELAKELLAKLLTTKLKIEWRKKMKLRAGVQILIMDELDAKLPNSYEDDEKERKAQIVFQHVYDKYPGDGVSIYNLKN